MDTIQACWQSDALKHSWTLPDDWENTPLKPCYHDEVHKLEEELKCLKELANKGIEEV